MLFSTSGRCPPILHDLLANALQASHTIACNYLRFLSTHDSPHTCLQLSLAHWSALRAKVCKVLSSDSLGQRR